MFRSGNPVGNGAGNPAVLAALAASPTPPAEQQAPSAAAADTVVLEAALRAIHQAIDLIGEPDTERLRTVRRVLRGAVIVAEDAGEAATAPQPVVREPQCWCLTCRPMRVDDPESIRMALCPTCGNKRCPKANNHRNQCSNSNEPWQKGSAYEGCGITQKGGSNADT